MRDNKTNISKYTICEQCKRKSVTLNSNGFCLECSRKLSGNFASNLVSNESPQKTLTKSQRSSESTYRHFSVADVKNLLPDFVFTPASIHSVRKSSENSRVSNKLLSPFPRPSLSSQTFHLVITEIGLTDDFKPDENTAKKNSEKLNFRCDFCKKKLTISNYYMCRCNLIFCSKHKYDVEHGCTFDYKAAGRAEISKQNPLVVKPKIEKI